MKKNTVEISEKISEKNSIEFIAPGEFVEHPDRLKISAGIDELPEMVKKQMDGAFERNPEIEVPILYSLFTDVDGVVKKGIWDGVKRAYYAVKNGAKTIPAIRVEVDSTKQIHHSSLIANQRFTSNFELGKAALELYNEYSVGQGYRIDLTDAETIPIYKYISDYLGGTVKESRVKLLKLIYESDPELLKKVDNDDNFSVSAAYTTIKKLRAPKVESYSTTSYKEKPAIVISGATNNTTSTGDIIEQTDDLIIDTTEFDNELSEEVNSEVEVNSEAERVRQEVDLELIRDKNFGIITCPCCSNALTINLKNNTTHHV